MPRPALRALPALGLIVLAALAPASAQTDETHSQTAACAWDRSHLVVHVVPPALAPLYTYNPNHTGALEPLPEGAATPWDSAHARAAGEASEAWERAMHAYAAARPEAAHLAGVTIETIVLTPDSDLAALPEPDVRVIFSPTLGVPAGIASTACTPSASGLYCPPEDPEGACVLGGTNVALTQWFVYSMTVNDTYNVALHEMGHALGLHHVTAPPEDVMQGVYRHPLGDERNPRNCASTLNLKQLATSFAWVGGAPYVYWPEGVTLSASGYALVC